MRRSSKDAADGADDDDDAAAGGCMVAVKPARCIEKRDSDTVITLDLEAVDVNLEAVVESPRQRARQPSTGGPPLQPPSPPLMHTPPLTSLPSGWKETKDAAGRVYYWNFWSRQVTCTRPVPTHHAPTVEPVPASREPSTLARAASGVGLARAPSLKWAPSLAARAPSALSRASSGLVDRARTSSRTREPSICHHSRRESHQRPSFSADI